MSDVCTVVSIFPGELREHKPQIPPEYVIPAGSYENPTVIYIKPATNVTYIDFERGSMKSQVPASEVAKSIVDDYKRSCLAFRGDDCRPGLFWLEGQVSELEILAMKDKPEKDNPLKAAKKAQEAWFSALVMMADDDYAKTGRPGLVSDLQRLAAKQLGMTREWLVNAQIRSTDCKFCGSAVLESVIVCPVCRNILNPAKYEETTKQLAAK